MEALMTDFEFSDYYSAADSYAGGGQVQLEFVNDPALVGEDVEWTFRTVGGATAPAGTVVAQIAVMSHDHNILGGGKTSIRNELGPHEVGESRIHPLQYTPQDGEYYLTITVGSHARNVAYRVHDHHVQAP
jgi:hypothetical protein